MGFVATGSGAGTKTNTPLIETPQSISVVTRQQLDAQQAQSLRDVARYSPGVYFSADADSRTQPVSARGFPLDQYLDGLRLLGGTWSVPRIDPWFLQRAEVISGPASILYGSASPGGILNLVSKTPSSTPFGEIQLQTGSYGRLQGAFDIGGPVDKEGKLSYRLTGLARDTGTQVSMMDEQRFAIAPSFTWRPDLDTTFTFLSSYTADPKGGFIDQLPLQGTLLPNKFGTIPRDFYVGDPSFEHLSVKQAMVGYQFEHNLNDVFTVRQNLRYTNIDLDYAEVQSTTLQADQHTLNRTAYMADELLNTFEVDNQLQAKFNTGMLQHTVLGGVDYQYKSFDNFTRFTVNGLPQANTLDILNPNYNQVIPLPPVFQNALQKQEQVGLYAQDQIKIGKLVFMASGREDWATENDLNRLNNQTTIQDDRAFTWRTGAVYLLENGLAPYASYATSFQPTVGFAFDGTTFKPTTGEQYEVGVKYQPAGWNAFATLALYDLTQQNVTTTDSQHPTFKVQTGEVNSRGVEISVVASPMLGLDLRASYTYFDNTITSANDGTVGKRLANTPDQVGSFFADYTIQSGALAGFGGGGGAHYNSESFTTNANTQLIPAYTLIDAAVHYDFGALRPDLKGLMLRVNANNVFDKQYVSGCSAVGCRWGTGRAVLATMSYKW